MNKIQSDQAVKTVETHNQMIENMRNKFIDDHNISVLEKAIKKINEKCRTPGKGDHVDVSV